MTFQESGGKTASKQPSVTFAPGLDLGRTRSGCSPALAVARGADALDNGIHAGVLGTGLLGLALAGAARRFDERGIDGLIAALVSGTRSLGARARTLQSGLVHKELLLAVVGGAVIFVLLAVGSW